MKKAGIVMLGVWCGFVNFISPIWLVMVGLNLTGRIYQYDYTMDEGTALIIGIALLLVWLVVGLMPNVYLARKLYSRSMKDIAIYLGGIAILWISCLAMCRWNVVDVLVT